MFRKGPLLLLLFLAISTPALCGQAYSESEGVEQERQSIDAFRKARIPHFHIVNVRDLIDLEGQQKTGVKPSAWTFDFMGQHTDLPRIEHDSVVVIFVHGYNTSLGRALRNGMAVRNMLVEIDDRLRAGKPTEPRRSPITFYAFLWRGDFGIKNFGTAQLAANAAGKSLAALIKQVADTADEHKIVVIAHSLGARVALESLKDLPIREGRPLVDSLVLVQGAVPATDLLKWNAIDILSERAPPTTCVGRYADSVLNARQFLYTFSAKDSVLYKWFSTKDWYAPIDRKCFLPVMDGAYSFLGRGAVRSTALGSPFKREAIEALPKLKRPWEKETHLSDPWGLHTLDERPSLNIEPPEHVFSFDFKLEHSNYKEVDLDLLDGFLGHYRLAFSDLPKRGCRDHRSLMVAGPGRVR